MPARKLSISVPEEIAEAAIAAAAAQGIGLSAWMAEAAQQELRRRSRMDVGFAEARALVSEYEAEHGPIPEEDWEWGRKVLADARASSTTPEP